MFINLSNHPSSKWSEEQREAAAKYGEITDIDFPVIDPKADTESVKTLASEMADRIFSLISSEESAVLVQGEFTYAYNVVSILKAKGIRVVAATTAREVVEETDTSGATIKKAIFRFIRFREY